MSFRPQIRPQLVLTNNNMSATVRTAPAIVEKLSLISFQFVWSAGSTPVGTAGIEVSNDYSLTPQGAVSNAGTWSTFWFQKSDGTYVTTSAISGTSGSVPINLFDFAFYAVRGVYTFTSGSGTLNVTLCAKVA